MVLIILSADELPRINQFLEQLTTGTGGTIRRRLGCRRWRKRRCWRWRTARILAGGRRLRITAASSGRRAGLELITAPTEAGNLEDRFPMLGDPPPQVEGMLSGGDMSMRVLRHLAASVSHRQYRETALITVQVAVEGGR